MRALIQRVSTASVHVTGEEVASISTGILVLIGAEKGDTVTDAVTLAKKISVLRIFDDDTGKMNLPIREAGGHALVVSQFTLCADTRKGRRPSFTRALEPKAAQELIKVFTQTLRDQGIGLVKEGVFGAHMKVELVNDGPVTFLLESKGGLVC
ncbi:MAG: D-tyrosyl-tRNA(Tyr) deacylase [Deltaproteobacteria bacterium]|nr:D-tyrosyl-tRNA(Tyr) deacylase [Deltaproteobacteria bacterium]